MVYLCPIRKTNGILYIDNLYIYAKKVYAFLAIKVSMYYNKISYCIYEKI